MMEEKVLTEKEKEEMKQIISNEELIEKEAMLSWDGKSINISLRLPKEIADYLEVNKENRFKKNILFRIRKKPDGIIEKSFDVVDRTKPKRKIKNAKKEIKITNKK